MMRKIPSLVDLCVQTAIDNVRYLGDVGDIEDHLLDRILFHCTLDQLRHIENSTVDRDLSPITDNLWKNDFKLEFGMKKFNTAVEEMKKKNATFKWKQLYEVKLKEREEASKKIGLKYKEKYAKAAGATAWRAYNLESNIKSKAKIEIFNSGEVKNSAAMKTKMVHRTHSVAPKAKPTKRYGFSASSSSSFVQFKRHKTR